MFLKLLGLDETGPVTALWWMLDWPWVALGLMVLAAGYAALLYRRERSLTGPRRAALAILRALALAVIVLLVFKPVLGLEMIAQLPRTLLVLLDTSESMSRADLRRSDAELRAAAVALGKLADANAQPADANAEAPLPQRLRAELSTLSRIELAKGVLANPKLRLLERLGRQYKLRYFRFGDRLEPTAGKGEVVPDALRNARATAPRTRLGPAIEEAVLRYSGQPIAGVIVLTDGAHNAGRDPVEVARRMEQRGVPIYPIGLGLADPPDVQVRDVIVADTVFHKDEVPVRVQIASSGYRNRRVDVSVLLDGRKVASRTAVLVGGSQFEELTFAPEQTGGTATLEVRVQPLPGEATVENNKLPRTVRIIDEKIHVLYVEGKPRWEYRYLRRVLLRDHRLDVKFLLTQGDRELAQQTDEHLADFPDQAARTFGFDLIIVGDVTASFFTHTQLARMEQLVKERGGSFLMIAGEQHAPGGYARTPIAQLLPVRVSAEQWQDLDDSVHPRITDAGNQSAMTSLKSPAQANRDLWANVRPLYRAPVLDGAKGGAVILAELSQLGRGGQPYPLIAWQRYGSGKSMFVGTDQLWRLRFKVGDRHHARFWGQAIQFLTLSRLLGENKRIRLETDTREALQGGRVAISANVLNENYDPVKKGAYTVYVDRLAAQKETVAVDLQPVPGIDGLYQGFYVAKETGQYVLRPAAAQAEFANRVEFLVKPSTLEQREPAMQRKLLEQVAAASGGRYFGPAELASLPQALGGERRVTYVRRDRELWDLPAVFGLVLLLLGVEWLLRRRYDLI